MPQDGVLPGGSAHFELQVSPLLFENAINKFLACEHPPNEATGEPLLQTSYCVHETVFEDHADLPANTLILGTRLGAYLHDLHRYYTEVTLRLRLAIEGSHGLQITLENLEFPESWSEEKRETYAGPITQLVEDLSALTTLPEDAGGLDLAIYLMKRLDNGHALLGVGLAGSDWIVDQNAFHAENDGLFPETGRLWGLSVHPDVIIKTLATALRGWIRSDVQLHAPSVSVDAEEISIEGHGTYLFPIVEGPGMTIRDCPIGFWYSVTITMRSSHIGEYLVAEVDMPYPDVSASDAIDCPLQSAELGSAERLVKAAIWAVFGIVPFLYLILDAWIDFLARKGFGGPGPLFVQGIELSPSGDAMKVSLAKVLGRDGGLFWPLQPRQIDFGDQAASIRPGHVTVIGDQGKVPDDLESEFLHPAYQFTASLAEHAAAEFEARRSHTGEPYADIEDVHLRNRTTDEMLAVCCWEIVEEEDSLFIGAFNLVNEEQPAGTLLIMPGCYFNVPVAFGPYVYDVAMQMWRPVTSFDVGFEVRARLKVTSLHVSEGVGNYVLEHKETFIELRGVVVRHEIRIDWPEGVHWRVPIDDQWIEEWQVWQGRLLDSDWWRDPFPSPEPDPLDRVIMHVSSRDPGLDRLALLDDQGKLLASASSNVNKSLSLMVDADRDYRVATTPEQGIAGTTYHLREVRLWHEAELAFGQKIVDVAHLAGVLAVANGKGVDFYAVSDPGRPAHLGRHLLKGACRILKTGRYNSRFAFVVADKTSVLVLLPETAPDAPPALVATYTLKPDEAGALLDVRLTGTGIVLATRKGLRVVSPTAKGKEFRAKWNVRDVAFGSGWIALYKGSAISLADYGSKSLANLGRLRHVPELESIEVEGHLLYLHEKGGGTVVVCADEPGRPREIARYSDTHYRRGMTVCGHQAYAVADNRKAVHCYRAVPRLIDRAYFIERMYRSMMPEMLGQA